MGAIAEAVTRDGLGPARDEEDWLRRGARALWFRAPWVLAGSTPVLAVVVAGVQVSGGSLLGVVLMAGLVGAPAIVAAAILAQRMVVDGDVRAGDLSAPGWRGWLRALALVWVVVVAGSITLAAFDAHGRAGAAAALVPAFLGLLVAGHGVVLAPTALALVLDRPAAPWRNVWVVAFLAAARRPVPVLGGWVAAGLLTWLALRVQVLMLVVPVVIAVVVISAAWTALGGLGVTPDHRAVSPDRH